MKAESVAPSARRRTARIEVNRFAEANVGWIAKVLAQARPKIGKQDLAEHTTTIFAAIEGAQLIARGCEDIAMFDRTVRAHRTTALIP